MDNRISIRFYEVHRENDDHPTMKKLLESVGKIEKLEDRETELSDDICVRLEHLEKDGNDAFMGEITRIQSTNYPSEVHPDGTKPLSTDKPLGHGIAFRLNHKNAVLGIQFDARIMAPGRFIEYLESKGEPSSLRLVPILRSDMWNRFSTGHTKKFEATVASPANLNQLERPDEPAAVAMRRMGQAYDAPTISIEISMGHKHGKISDKLKQFARDLLNAASLGTVDVRKLKATMETGQGIPNDKIDLIEEFLSERTSLDLPENDPDRNYKLRKNYLRTVMKNHGY